MSKKRLVVANWKLYIESPQEAKKFVSRLRRKSRLFSGVEVVIAPTYPLIPTVALGLKGSQIKVGAQTVSHFNEAKHTGDVSAHAIKLAGASYAIVGHSERRAQGESDEMIQVALKRAIEAGVIPILCVGELERNGEGSHFTVLEKQLSALRGIDSDKLVIAYEPVWAIGKRAEDAIKAQELTELVIFIRKTLAEYVDRKAALKIPILYGGSVEPENASALINESGISGFLVGHASADPDSFFEILQACRK